MRGRVKCWCVAAWMVAAVVACGSGDTRPAAPAASSLAAMVVDVQTGRDLGPLPALYRPSVMLSFADAPAVEHMLALPGSFGALRLTLEPLVQRFDLEEPFFEELARQATVLSTVARGDGALFITMARMPAWLASDSSTVLDTSYGYLRREALPPKSQDAYRSFIERVARTLAASSPKRPLHYEFWNEPDLEGFWRGSRTSLFDTWVSFAQGVRAGDPQAQVGGPCLSTWAAATPAADRAGANPLLTADFLSFIATRPAVVAPPDFLCWHNFGRHPEQEWWGADSVREWLAQASLPTALPQVINEWNLWSTFPADEEPMRDGARAAAYMASALPAMDQAGIRFQTLAALQDYRASPSEDPFHGDFGALTREPMIEKAAFKVLRMQSQLLPWRSGVSLSDIERADADAVNAVATSDAGGRVAVMVSRYGGDFAVGFLRSLARSGYPGGRGLSLDGKRLEQFASGAIELGPSEVDAKQYDALLRARQIARLGASSDLGLPVHLQVNGSDKTRWRYTLYVIDSLHNNPQVAYRNARAAGRSLAEAVAVAQAVGFAPSLSGEGVLPEFTLERYAVALVLLEPPGP